MQETFQNIIKHADAKNIIVVIKQDQFNIEVKVVDDGKGFFYDEFDKSPANTGSGLTNMKRRAEFIDCSISFSQLGDSGTVVKLVYPIRNNYQL